MDFLYISLIPFKPYPIVFFINTLLMLTYTFLLFPKKQYYFLWPPGVPKSKEDHSPSGVGKIKLLTVHSSIHLAIYLSSAMFLVCPEPRLSTTSQRSTTLVPCFQKFTSMTCSLIAEFELLNRLDSWNFFHFFSEKGFRLTEYNGSMSTE